MSNISERRLHALIGGEIGEISMFGFTVGAWGNVFSVVRPFVCRFHPATCFQNPAKSC